MTNEEAIKILQSDGCCQDCTFGGYPCKLVGCETHQAIDLAIKALEEKPTDEWVRKEDVIHYIATQYSEHNELVPVWLSIGDMKGGAK